MLMNLNVYFRLCLCLLDGYHHDVYFYKMINIYYRLYIGELISKFYIWNYMQKKLTLNKKCKDIFINYKV